MTMRWTTAVLACDEPEGEAEFWAALLGSEVRQISADFFAVPHGTAWLAMQKSPHSPATWPDGDRPALIHLDVAVQDVGVAVLRARALGASEAPEQPHPDTWRVMRSPAGHLFCLSSGIGSYLPIADID